MQSDQFGESLINEKCSGAKLSELGVYRKSVSEVHNEKTDELCDI